MFDFQTQSELVHLLVFFLDCVWNLPTYNCCLSFTNLTITEFTVICVVHEIQKRMDAAKLDLRKLHLDAASILQPVGDAPHDRTRRATLVAAVVFGAFGVFGTGIAMGSGSCGLSRIFGSSQSEENADSFSRHVELFQP